MWKSGQGERPAEHATFSLIRTHSNQRSHQVEYLIAALKILLLNDRGSGFYNAEVFEEEPAGKCTW
jgi:hypothetical protein